MKTFKLSLSLFLNQILSTVGGFMCIIFVNLLAGDTIAAHILFLVMTMPFFIYINYRASFTAGFHDSDRRNNPKSKAFLHKGALAGVISIIPLIILVTIYGYYYLTSQIGWSNLYKIIIRIYSMYYNFPMCNLFPNHSFAVILSSLILPVFVPWLGYIAGYKNFVVLDKFLIYLKAKNKK